VQYYVVQRRRSVHWSEYLLECAAHVGIGRRLQTSTAHAAAQPVQQRNRAPIRTCEVPAASKPKPSEAAALCNGSMRLGIAVPLPENAVCTRQAVAVTPTATSAMPTLGG
jgi:hypothetical protein